MKNEGEAERRGQQTWAKPAEWRKLMLNGMARDFSWTVSAREYIKVYEKVRAARLATPV